MALVGDARAIESGGHRPLMIALHPIPQTAHCCPYDSAALVSVGWYVPGMRNLADLHCSSCGREFFGDLWAGHGLDYPMLLDKESGRVFHQSDATWFAEWLRKAYARRCTTPLGLTTEERRPLRKPLLLNCLDSLYGHALLKLLNAQYYLDHEPDVDVVALIPKCLRWMVPEEVAAVWAVDLPLARGAEWNDWLAKELKRMLAPYAECHLSVAYSHPHPDSYSIERFTGVAPFPVSEWYERLRRPTVTFIMRDERTWGGGLASHLLQSAPGRLGDRFRQAGARRAQVANVTSLAERLLACFPNLDFALAGLSHGGSYPPWISDMRTIRIDGAVERAWCERYARSHLVVGVFGSGLLLPSAHAGATIDLVPPYFWANITQDLLMADLDCREALLRHRMLPLSESPAGVAEVAASVLRDLPAIRIGMAKHSVDHNVGRIPQLRQERERLLQKRREALDARQRP